MRAFCGGGATAFLLCDLTVGAFCGAGATAFLVCDLIALHFFCGACWRRAGPVMRSLVICGASSLLFAGARAVTVSPTGEPALDSLDSFVDEYAVKETAV